MFDGWQPIEIAIQWGPCVVVRRCGNRESLSYSYEVISIWPRTSDLNHAEFSEYKQIDEVYSPYELLSSREFMQRVLSQMQRDNAAVESGAVDMFRSFLHANGVFMPERLINWVPLHDFDALPGDVVLRRWRLRETGQYRYSLIENWKSKEDYLLGNEFILVDNSGLGV